MSRKEFTIKIDEEYESVIGVMYLALERLVEGKGEKRHTPSGPPRAIQDQQICNTRREVGPGYTMGQVAKKAYEASRMDESDKRIRECLDIINYAVAEVIVSEESTALSCEVGSSVSIEETRKENVK